MSWFKKKPVAVAIVTPVIPVSEIKEYEYRCTICGSVVSLYNKPDHIQFFGVPLEDEMLACTDCKQALSKDSSTPQ